jgi:hypothetical protein
MWNLLPVIYSDRIIIDTSKAPFDGKPVLIKTNTGIVEAWWDNSPSNYEKDEYGFCWVCYDNEFQLPIDYVYYWMPLPKEEYQSKDSKEFLSIESDLMVINAKQKTILWDEFFKVK